MIKKNHLGAAAVSAALLVGSVLAVVPAPAAVSSQEAAALKSTLTPLGADKAANKDGTIPAWTGNAPTWGYRDDPFAKEQPVVTITAKNMQEYADRLTDGTKTLLTKYPDFKVVVYPTHRTMAAPQWVYDGTYENALHGKLNGNLPQNVYGGIPFPIPKNGAEIIWNHLLRIRAETVEAHFRGIQTTADGRHVLTAEGLVTQQIPYYFKGGQSRFRDQYYQVTQTDYGPPIRAGEAVDGWQSFNPDKSTAFLYLVGQRRVRELPNPCCDTPTPTTAGVMTFDELENFSGRLDRYDWKIVGKKEMYIPYNDNRVNQVSDDLLLAHFLNPDRVRWELHRVWVVEATLRPGQRHQVPRAMFYADEDSWLIGLSDRWDAHNQLWKVGFDLPFAMTDTPGMPTQTFGEYDLESGSWYVLGSVNFPAGYYKKIARLPDEDFTPDALLRGAR